MGRDLFHTYNIQFSNVKNLTPNQKKNWKNTIRSVSSKLDIKLDFLPIHNSKDLEKNSRDILGMVENVDPNIVKSILGDSIDRNRKVESFNSKFKVKIPCTKRQ